MPSLLRWAFRGGRGVNRQVGSGGGNPFAPYGTLIVDLDPRYGLFQEAAGTTPATAADDPVGLVRDQSGQGNHLSQSTAGLRATLKLSVVNGLPALAFTGGDFIGRAGFTLSAFTVFAVITTIGGAGTNRHILGQWTTTGNQREWRILQTSGNVEVVAHSTDGTSSGNTANSTIAAGIRMFRYGLTAGAIRFQINDQTAVTATVTLFDGSGLFTVGDMSDVSQPGEFSLLRLLMYGNALSDEGVTAVKAALSALYSPFS